MRILWVSLIKLPELCQLQGEAPPKHACWMDASSKRLLDAPEIQKLAYLCEDSKAKRVEKIEGAQIRYYVVPKCSYAKRYAIQSHLQEVYDDFRPDITHVFGSEHPLAYHVSNTYPVSTTLVSLQGLPHVIARYYLAQLSWKDIFFNISIKDILRQSFVLSMKRKMEHRGKYERRILEKAVHVMGRTHWDYAHLRSLNTNANYYVGNEALRDSFYFHNWLQEDCQAGRIFLSNSNEPLKGAHMVVKALPLIIKHFPNAHLYIVGADILHPKTWKDKLRLTGYNLYLARLIRKLGLTDRVTFLGALDEEEMCAAFLQANVYVLPSSIENSPNSLCEAQMLGVPIVAAAVGGVADFVKDKETGFLYRFEEIEVLAERVIHLLKDNNHEELSQRERQHALQRHNVTSIQQELITTYQKIIASQQGAKD